MGEVDIVDFPPYEGINRVGLIVAHDNAPRAQLLLLLDVAVA